MDFDDEFLFAIDPGCLGTGSKVRKLEQDSIIATAGAVALG